MNDPLLLASSGLATVALVVGCGLAGLWVWTPPIVALGILWLIALWRRWGWMSSLAFFLCVGAAAAALLLGVGTGWMLLAVVMALMAWDVDDFGRRLRSVDRVEGRQDLERSHLLRLLAVAVLGVLLAMVALGVRLELGFGAVLLLGLMAVVGLSRAIGFLRRESD